MLIVSVLLQERVIADAKQYDALWSKVFDQYLFKPGYINWRNQQWIVLPEENTTFMLSDNSCWNDKQESIINSSYYIVIAILYLFYRLGYAVLDAVDRFTPPTALTV